MPADRPPSRPSLTVRPFRGWRFTDGLTQTYVPPGNTPDSDVVAPMPRMMRAVLAVDEEEPAARLGGDRVGRQLLAWRRDRVLVQDEAPGYYLYRRTDSDRAIVGLIAAISLHPPHDRVVVPHEGVNPVMVRRQVHLMDAFMGQPEPVVTAHRGSDAFRAVVGLVLRTPPNLLAHTEQIRHELWQVADAELVGRLGRELTGATLLLADGHHRYAAFRQLAGRKAATHQTGVVAAPWELGLSMLIDDGDTGLQLGPIHRVLPHVPLERVRTTPGVSVKEGRSDGGCVLTDGERSWTLVPEPIASRLVRPPAPELIVSLLHREWLPHWSVPESDVSYVHNADAAVAQASTSGGLALLLPSPTVNAVFEAAASGNLMPAKATSFQPKPLIGLVMRHWPGEHSDL